MFSTDILRLGNSPIPYLLASNKLTNASTTVICDAVGSEFNNNLKTTQWIDFYLKLTQILYIYLATGFIDKRSYLLWPYRWLVFIGLPPLVTRSSQGLFAWAHEQILLSQNDLGVLCAPNKSEHKLNTDVKHQEPLRCTGGTQIITPPPQPMSTPPYAANVDQTTLSLEHRVFQRCSNTPALFIGWWETSLERNMAPE